LDELSLVDESLEDGEGVLAVEARGLSEGGVGEGSAACEVERDRVELGVGVSDAGGNSEFGRDAVLGAAAFAVLDEDAFGDERLEDRACLHAVDAEELTDVAVADRSFSGDGDEDDRSAGVEASLLDQSPDPGAFAWGDDAAELEGHGEERAVVCELGGLEELGGHVVFHAVDALAEILGESHSAERAEEPVVAGGLLVADVVDGDGFGEPTG
jgi:hypothetical protein